MVRTLKQEEAIKETPKETMLEFMLFSIFVSDLKWEITRKLANFADYTQLHVISKRKLSIVAERASHYTEQNSPDLLPSEKQLSYPDSKGRHPDPPASKTSYQKEVSAA